MLLKFSFTNHRSFKDEQEISLVATTLKDNPGAARSLDGLEEPTLCVAAIYGANASGKTNVLRALQFMRRVVRESQRAWSPDRPVPTEPFLLGSSPEAASSRFELDIVLNGTRVRYGFKLDSERILSEWMYAYPSGRRQVWFERDHSSDPSRIRFGKSLTGENRTIENLTRKDSLFLSAAAQNNHEQLTPLYLWFSEQLELLTQPRDMLTHDTSRLCSEDEEMRKAILRLLREADLGVVGLDVAEEEPRDLFIALPALTPDFFNKPIFKSVAIWTPTLLHQTADSPEGVPFPFENESNGTRALFELLGPAIKALQSGGVLLIDELDASLHPLLAIEFVRLFNDPDRNPKCAQLIFSTHDTNLLDPTLLRRDQIWFVEKDKGGASHLYPLTDFKPRKHESFGRGYLQGRYGAVPFIGPLDISEPAGNK